MFCAIDEGMIFHTFSYIHQTSIKYLSISGKNFKFVFMRRSADVNTVDKFDQYCGGSSCLLKYSFATLEMARAHPRRYHCFIQILKGVAMWGKILKSISTNIDVYALYLVFCVTVIWLSMPPKHQIATDAQRSVETYLHNMGERENKYPELCSHEMLMVKDGNGYWEYVKPKDNMYTGKATVKCK